MSQTACRSILLMFLVQLGGPAAQASQNVVVVLDDSGSMDEPTRADSRQKKIAAARSALLVVLGQLPPDAQVGILLLNGTVQGSPWAIPMGSADAAAARAALRNVRAEGLTPLGQKIKLAADALLELRKRQHYGEYRLLIVTDGEATDGHLLARYLPDVLSRGLTVDVIGVDMNSDHSLATRVDSYRRADDRASLERAIRAVFAETATVADDSPADFAALAGFPSDVAAAALTALAESGNQPIGEETEPLQRRGEHGRSSPPLKPDMAVPAAPAPAPPGAAARREPPPPARRPRGSWVVYAVALLMIFLALAQKHRWRRRG